MSKKFKRILSFALCVLLCANLCVPVLAVNSQGISFQATLDKTVLTASDEAQTVVMNITPSSGITTCAIGYTVVCPDAITLTGIASGDDKVNMTAADYNLTTKKVSWQQDTVQNVSDITNLGVITFTVPANTPAGTYTLGVERINLSTNLGQSVWEDSGTASATLTIVDGSTNSYVASLNSTDTDLNVGEQLTVNVSVAGVGYADFASGEVIVEYDSTKLTFNKTASNLGKATIPEQINGTIKLEDYGETKNFGNAYSLVFDTVAEGTAEVKLTSAKFSTYANAASDNLVEATLSNAAITAKLTQVYSVTLPDGFTGASTVQKGENYTFSADDTDNYTYTVTATMGGGNAFDVTANQDGTYTISNVTGVLVISATPKANSYTVTFAGEGAEDVTNKVTTATYKTDYTFTLPSNTADHTYSLTSIKYAGGGDVPYTTENGVVTVAGTNITDAFTITIAKEKVLPTTASVTVEGASSDVTYSTTATPGADYTFTVNKDSRYDYEVSATVNGEEIALTPGENGQYSIPYSAFKAGDAIKISVVKTVRTDNVKVDKYVTVDESEMWLITINTTKMDGSVYTYKGSNMYWSAIYGTKNAETGEMSGAYCYLVVAAEQPVVTASDLTIITGSVTEVDYSMDVNMTGVKDANDAQLAYNMYKPYYANFTTDVTMEEFLRADVNYDGKIDMSDPQAIINSLLSQTGD